LEYDNVVRISYIQDHHFASVEVTSGYLGGTPATWELEMPDFSGVDGWDNSWGLDPAASPSMDRGGGGRGQSLRAAHRCTNMIGSRGRPREAMMQSVETARRALFSRIRPKAR
jgi:hypothetical protein